MPEVRRSNAGAPDPNSVAPVLPTQRKPPEQVGSESQPITHDVTYSVPEPQSTPEPVAVPEPPAYRSTEKMYECVSDQWGSTVPIFFKGDTFLASQLPPTRDLKWAIEQLVVAEIPATDPRSLIPPTGPRGDQSAIPADGWHSVVNPEHLPADQVPAIVKAMQAAGATPAMIAAVKAQATRVPVGAPPVPTGAPGTF